MLRREQYLSDIGCGLPANFGIGIVEFAETIGICEPRASRENSDSRKPWRTKQADELEGRHRRKSRTTKRAVGGVTGGRPWPFRG